MWPWSETPAPAPPPPPISFAQSVIVGVITVVLAAALVFAFLRRSKSSGLEKQLEAAHAQVQLLEKQLAAQGSWSVPRAMPAANSTAETKPIRIWMDGAFDMMHYGHVNAFRQGRALGTHLVVGVNDDESITRCKGPPVMDNTERVGMVAGCKFVDEVVPNVPYVMSDEYIRWVMDKYKIDFVVHGDDPCIVDGRDVYESAQRLGKYRTIPRTEGVSTTEIVGRMLLLTTDHHEGPHTAKGTEADLIVNAGETSPLVSSIVAKADKVPPQPLDAAAPAALAAASSPSRHADRSFVRESKFLTTSRMLRLFASGCTAPPPGARVVYVDGGWDMFHAGHVDFLRRARELGDFLIVGVHNDVVTNRHRGKNFPIMNLNERTLSVLSCKHVGDVVIDPPWHMTREMIAALSISVVAHGSTNDPNDDGGLDPYAVPKQMGLFRELPSPSSLTVDSIVQRIRANHERMAAKVERKMAAEKEYYENRYGFATETAG